MKGEDNVHINFTVVCIHPTFRQQVAGAVGTGHQAQGPGHG
jgi:hypothetical protein